MTLTERTTSGEGIAPTTRALARMFFIMSSRRRALIAAAEITPLVGDGTWYSVPRSLWGCKLLEYRTYVSNLIARSVSLDLRIKKLQ